jgi:hypothetical protein
MSRVEYASTKKRKESKSRKKEANGSIYGKREMLKPYTYI